MGKYARLEALDRMALNGLLVFGRRAPRRVLAAGRLVRAARLALLMSQRQLARRSGVAQPHIAQIERGARDVHVETLARLLDALFCDLVLVPRPRRHFGDLRHEQADKSSGLPAYFHKPNPRMWKK